MMDVDMEGVNDKESTDNGKKRDIRGGNRNDEAATSSHQEEIHDLEVERLEHGRALNELRMKYPQDYFGEIWFQEDPEAKMLVDHIEILGDVIRALVLEDENRAEMIRKYDEEQEKPTKRRRV